MTLNQLESLTEEELEMCLYIVNNIFPSTFPKIEYQPHQLVWIRPDKLIKKITDAFPRIKPEGHEIFKSLLSKLGIQVEISQVQPTLQPPVSGSTELSGSLPISGSLPQTGSQENTNDGTPNT